MHFLEHPGHFVLVRPQDKKDPLSLIIFRDGWANYILKDLLLIIYLVCCLLLLVCCIPEMVFCLSFHCSLLLTLAMLVIPQPMYIFAIAYVPGYTEHNPVTMIGMWKARIQMKQKHYG